MVCFYDCYKFLLFLIYFDIENTFFVESVAFIDNQVHVFHLCTVFEFIYDNRLHQFVEFGNPIFNISFRSFGYAKPSSMYRLKRIGHPIIGSFLVFSFNIFSSLARSKLARIGATFVPIIMPNIC